MSVERLTERHLKILRVLKSHDEYPLTARTIKRYVVDADMREGVDASDISHEMRHLVEMDLVDVHRRSNRNRYSIINEGRQILEECEGDADL